jgi:hypothetical protein
LKLAADIFCQTAGEVPARQGSVAVSEWKAIAPATETAAMGCIGQEQIKKKEHT